MAVKVKNISKSKNVQAKKPEKNTTDRSKKGLQTVIIVVSAILVITMVLSMVQF